MYSYNSFRRFTNQSYKDIISDGIVIIGHITFGKWKYKNKTYKTMRSKSLKYRAASSIKNIDMNAPHIYYRFFSSYEEAFNYLCDSYENWDRKVKTRIICKACGRKKVDKNPDCIFCRPDCENCGGTGECETELYEGLTTCWLCKNDNDS